MVPFVYVDYIGVNKNMVPDQYSIPRINELNWYDRKEEAGLDEGLQSSEDGWGLQVEDCFHMPYGVVSVLPYAIWLTMHQLHSSG